jgi:predicted enzyme related to lactoylglutathione lyase
MAQVIGVGGVFLRADNPDKLYAWYEEFLGVKRTDYGAFAFTSDGPGEMTLLNFFPAKTEYFASPKQQAMLNLRVDDMDGIVEKLRAAGPETNLKQEDSEYGRFAWFHDPEGNRVELWQASA